jgi:hypothetical protein
MKVVVTHFLVKGDGVANFNCGIEGSGIGRGGGVGCELVPDSGIKSQPSGALRFDRAIRG